jgi:hypothetical protein
MDISHRSAGSGATERTADLHPESAAYLTHLAREQDRFLASVAEAGARVGDGPGQLGKVVAIQNRLTQEFLDAQRSILRRRAETEAAVVQIEYSAARDVQQVYAAVRSAPARWPAPPSASTLPAPSGWAAPAPHGPVRAPSVGPGAADPARAPRIADADMAMIARLVDGAFEQREPDGDVMRRQLREVLDGWWTAEQHEAKAAVDDATARAAMRLHTARVEVADITRADQIRAEFASPTYRYEPPRHVSPLIDALDTTNHQDLDDVLASLLDDLDGKSVPAPVDQAAVEQHESTQPPVAPPRRSTLPRVAAPIPTMIPTPVLPPPAGSVAAPVAADSLTDETAAPQEAFDRFWGPRSARSSDGRDWVFPQLLLPAVAVIAVLALVLAVVG